MSFKAELTVDNKTYSVRRFHVITARNMDAKGRPSGKPEWGIFLLMDAVDDTTITSWMIDPTKQMDGKLTIYKIDQDAKLKEIKFEKSYCTAMIDTFMFDRSYSTCEIHIHGKDLYK
ncbi:MAG TPA: type VI secretion system tube protein TssD [Puia sp.]|nr:type VI secretion system tube protein TssD [Puia sp.]